jgi:hypothetical protein
MDVKKQCGERNVSDKSQNTKNDGEISLALAVNV